MSGGGVQKRGRAGEGAQETPLQGYNLGRRRKAKGGGGEGVHGLKAMAYLKPSMRAHWRYETSTEWYMTVRCAGESK